jgi:signal recognition particle receptor subunit beta
MVLFNYSTKELTAKVVYYGPGLCGKTTNLQWIHEKLPIKNKGKMLSLATETDRTLFFDFLPIELGAIRGMRTRIQLYTVPGQVFYNATRRMVLKGADCVVFVADSQEPMLDANVESMENLRQNLEANEIDADEIPTVIQYNKRDLPNALPLEIMNARLNPRGRPFFEAVAVKGQGVEETLKGVTTLVFRSLANKYGASDAAQHGTPTTAPGTASASGTPGSGTAPRIPVPERPVVPPAPVAAAVAPRAAAPPVPAPAMAKAPVAAPRPEPAPVIQARPTPLNAGARDTIPPVPLESDDDYDEDLLDSLHLSPDGDDDEVMVEDPEPDALSLDVEEPLDVVEEDDEPPSRQRVRVGTETVASTPRETEMLRQRIGRPLSDLDLERIEEEEQEVEEISLDSPAPSAAPAFRPYLEEDLFAERPPARAEQPQPPATVPPAPAPASALAASVPVSVDLVASGPGQADVAIPVEIVLNNGTAQVNLHVRLTLNLKIQQ